MRSASPWPEINQTALSLTTNTLSGAPRAGTSAANDAGVATGIGVAREIVAGGVAGGRDDVGGRDGKGSLANWGPASSSAQPAARRTVSAVMAAMFDQRCHGRSLMFAESQFTSTQDNCVTQSSPKNDLNRRTSANPIQPVPRPGWWKQSRKRPTVLGFYSTGLFHQ